jgi:hypothetical protein
MTYTNVETLPAGEYLFGDTCYANIHNELEIYSLEPYLRTGRAQVKEQEGLLGSHYLAFVSSGGDGVFRSFNERGERFSDIPVDSGTIGVVSIGLGSPHRFLSRVTIGEEFEILRSDNAIKIVGVKSGKTIFRVKI